MGCDSQFDGYDDEDETPRKCRTCGQVAKGEHESADCLAYLLKRIEKLERRAKEQTKEHV